MAGVFRDSRVNNQVVTKRYSVGDTLTTQTLDANVVEAQQAKTRDLFVDPGSGQPIQVNDLVVADLNVDQLVAETITADTLKTEEVENLMVTTLTADTVTATTVTATDYTTDNVAVSTTLTAPNVINLVPTAVQDLNVAGVTVIPWPAGTVSAQIQVVGGGGGGGGPTTPAISSSGGGGSSGYALFTLSPAQIAAYTGLTIDVGTAGAAGADNADGSDGGTTTVTLNGSPSLVVCSCPGGSGGLIGSNDGVGGDGGATPTLTQVVGQVEPGRPGQNAWINLGSVANNSNGGMGGDSRLGSGGDGGSDGGPPVDARAGVGGGGGGGGATDNGKRLAAAGGPGRCIIVWYGGF